MKYRRENGERAPEFWCKKAVAMEFQEERK
jgi:hypothetical protein